MRQAPPVRVPVGFFLGARGVGLALALLAAWGWLQLVPLDALRWGVHGYGLALVLACAGVSWALADREALPPGRLHWDGQDWWYTPTTRLADAIDAIAVDPQVLWDTGGGLLLQLRSREAGWRLPRHTWLSARQVQGLGPEGAGRWHGLRCALYGQDIL